MSDIKEEWTCGKRKKFSTPYNFSEKLSWLKNQLIGPSNKFKRLTQFIPQNIQLNQITPRIKLGFVGDIMRMKNRKMQPSIVMR